MYTNKLRKVQPTPTPAAPVPLPAAPVSPVPISFSPAGAAPEQFTPPTCKVLKQAVPLSCFSGELPSLRERAEAGHTIEAWQEGKKRKQIPHWWE